MDERALVLKANLAHEFNFGSLSRTHHFDSLRVGLGQFNDFLLDGFGKFLNLMVVVVVVY